MHSLHTSALLFVGNTRGGTKGQSDLQSDALPLSYAPCYIINLHNLTENDVKK